MTIQVVYDDAELQVIHRLGASNCTLMAFSAIIYRNSEPNFWAKSPSEKYDLNCLCFIPKRKNYFPKKNMMLAYGAILPFIFGEVINYGASMGGYAALKYSMLFGAKSTLAFSPQFSVNPTDVPFDLPRHSFFIPDLHQEMALKKEDVARNAAIFYDPHHDVDTEHFRLIIAAVGSVIPVSVPYCGHDVISVMAESRLFSEMINAALTYKLLEFRKLINKKKNGSCTYLSNLGSYAAQNNRLGKAKKIWEIAVNRGLEKYIVIALEAHALFRSGHPGEAKTQAERALECMDFESSSAVAVSLGDLLSDVGDFILAERAYGLAYKIDPKIVSGIIGLTAVLGKQGRYIPALNLANVALEELKNEPELWGRIGWLQLETKQPQLAIESFRQGIMINSTIKHLHDGLEKAKNEASLLSS